MPLSLDQCVAGSRLTGQPSYLLLFNLVQPRMSPRRRQGCPSASRRRMPHKRVPPRPYGVVEYLTV